MVLQAKVKLEPKSREPATPTSPGVFSRLRRTLRSISFDDTSSDVPEHTRGRQASVFSVDDQNQMSNKTPLKR